MKICGNRIYIMLMLGLFAYPVLGQDTARSVMRHELSLQEVVDYAEKNSEQVKNALLEVQMQRQVNREITAAAYPHLNGSVGATYNPNVATQVIPNFISPSVYQVLIDQGVKDGSGNPIEMPNDIGLIAAQFGTKYTANAGLSLSQILFDGQVFVGLQARATSIALVNKSVDVTKENIKANIYKVYYQLVVSKRQIELLDSNIALIEKLRHDTRIMHENGFSEKLDVDKAEVQLANLKTERQKALNAVSNGYYGLKTLMGMPIHDVLVLTDTLSDNELRSGVLDASLYSYQDREDFQYASLGKKLYEYDVSRYKLSQIPTISLSGNYAKSAQRDKFDFFGKGDWFTISSINLNIAIPIFNGFATKAKIAQAEIKVRQLDNQLEALKLSIDKDVAQAKNNYTSAISTLDYQQKNMELAETVYQQTKKKYEIGTGSQMEINMAQTDMKAAQTNYINALYDAVIAKVDFLKATGKL